MLHWTRIHPGPKNCPRCIEITAIQGAKYDDSSRMVWVEISCWSWLPPQHTYCVEKLHIGAAGKTKSASVGHCGTLLHNHMSYLPGFRHIFTAPEALPFSVSKGRLPSYLTQQFDMTAYWHFKIGLLTVDMTNKELLSHLVRSQVMSGFRCCSRIFFVTWSSGLFHPNEFHVKIQCNAIPHPSH